MQKQTKTASESICLEKQYARMAEAIEIDLLTFSARSLSYQPEKAVNNIKL